MRQKYPLITYVAGRENGFKIAMNALNVGRIKLGVACLEAQRRVINNAVQYANERVQFNKPISHFGAIKEKIARMATSCYVGESANYRAAHDIELKIHSLRQEGLDHQKAELKGVEEFAIECSMIKVGTSEDIQNCADDGIQIFGGMGFRRTHQWSQHGEMLELGEYMRVQTKLTECCQLECYLKNL